MTWVGENLYNYKSAKLKYHEDLNRNLLRPCGPYGFLENKTNSPTSDVKDWSVDAISEVIKTSGEVLFGLVEIVHFPC